MVHVQVQRWEARSFWNYPPMIGVLSSLGTGTVILTILLISIGEDV
jgi:hypothetical protein